MIFTVHFGDSHKVSVRMDSHSKIVAVHTPDGDVMTDAEDFDGGSHNFSGLAGAVIDRAVRKEFGSHCFWFGESGDRSYGQVFEAYRYSAGSRTSCIRLRITYRDKGTDVDML